MIAAHDVYSETNPAFCGVVLVTFIDSYTDTKGHGPDLALAYLALPIALSSDLGSTFEGTNRRTGLSMWLGRHPQIQIGIADKVNDTLIIVTEAFRFSVFTRVVLVGSDGRLGMGPKKVKASVLKALGDGPQQAIKRAERLGIWFADTGTTHAVFDTMGLTV